MIKTFKGQKNDLSQSELDHSTLGQEVSYQYETRVMPPNAPAKLVIIIDDVGVSYKNSMEVIRMKQPLTLAFLPYAEGLGPMTELAQENGHELLIHMPMQPMNEKLDTGPIALKPGMEEKEFRSMLDQAFESFDGYIGINNHMGSKLTQDQESMDLLMDILAEHDLMFVDSKTIHSSVAGRTAKKHGLVYAERDVFLDHEDSDEFVLNALKLLENVAKRKGYAIAIGHPKASTIRGLKQWIPTLKERGFEIVPVSEVAHRPRALLTQDAQAPDTQEQNQQQALKKSVQ
jgi:hypothetical protein